ncbi:MAG: hypothetical protein A3C38_07260 [Planctomycetes bacterium RIFCSPHIGHO2_02_FULL_50_42]|nr:MAG: hypothetical protein A3C38_07260 [Planctomycetes bacterium RIFCSPHIGHO2_02_FULL_50_42]OHB91826.1 MAG: hypothetical protein A3E75_05245 [Planctomycetes bacterium RIFCSPHIGHO2_12_FULL_51_37]HCN18759.1 hypothetical protein [Planctomycetia bacterium]
MMITKEKPINKKAVDRFRMKSNRVIDGVMREGFYGTVNMELVLVDGIIRNIKTSIEEQENIDNDR